MKKILLGLVILAMFATSAHAIVSGGVVTVTKRENWGSSRVVYGYITYTAASYSTGGMELTARDVGLDNVHSMIVADLSSPVLGWVYDYANAKTKLYYSETNQYQPTAAPVTADYFTVVDDNDAASHGKLLVVCATGGGSGAYFGMMDATGVAGSSTIAYSRFSAADAATTVAVLDSANAPFIERGYLVYADTVFFDDDATNAYDRLMYSGIGLGSMGDLYVAFGNGNLIKIAKKTNSQITQAAALPLYFDENATINLKLLSVTDGDANSTFSANTDYTDLPRYNPFTTEELTSGQSVSASVRFVAIGN